MLVTRKPTANGVPTDEKFVQRFARLREVYGLVQEAEASARGVVLDRECAGDEALRTSVQQLMDASGPLHESFDPDRGEIARAILRGAPSRAPLEHVGPYRILRELGRGGMGTVYLARQDQPCRDVALKVLEERHEADEMALRFAREVRALARLDHPGIARIYDAGSAETSRGFVCYFAMQYVAGTRLTQHAEDHRLDTASRLALIAAVADAVQHAHTKGVIHRDLKPSNVLVHFDQSMAPGKDPAAAGNARPVVLDFGVARVLDAGRDETALTEAGLLVGTIAYMSPEQLAGESDAVDARTDVYAMGVLLYELLTSRLPFDVRGKPIAEAARIIRDEPPKSINVVRPDTAGRFDRDLELIVAKAIAKDRDQRYRTAAALADDIRRYLGHEPITARPTTLSYQLATFARRHRGLVAGVTVAVMTLFAGLGVSVSLYLRAEQQRAHAEEQWAVAQEQRAHAEAERERADAEESAGAALQGYLINDLLKAAAPDRLGQDARIIDVLLEARVGLAERFAGQPEEEARVRAALADVFSALGRLPEASAERDEVVRLLEARLGTDDERVIDALLHQSRALVNLRRVLVAERIAEGALDRIRRAHPDNGEMMVQALQCIASCCEQRAHYGRAINLLREASEVAQRLPGDHRGLVLSMLSDVLYCERRRRDSNAEVTADLARQIREQMRAIPADDPALARILLGLMKDDLARGRLDDALATADLLAPKLDREIAPQRMAPMASALARTYLAGARFELAESFAIKGYDAYATAFPVGTQSQENLSRLLIDIYSSWGEHDDALHAWCLRWVAYRLLYASPELRGGCVARVRDAETLLGTTSRATDVARLIHAVWEERDAFAPVGHPRRAFFLENATFVAAALGNPDDAAEAREPSNSAAPPTKTPDESEEKKGRKHLESE